MNIKKNYWKTQCNNLKYQSQNILPQRAAAFSRLLTWEKVNKAAKFNFDIKEKDP